MPCLERAEKLARAALAVDPHQAFGHVWLAVALGYEARVIGIVRARLKDSPAQSRAALDAAVAEDPKNAYACRRSVAGISRSCAAAAPPWAVPLRRERKRSAEPVRPRGATGAGQCCRALPDRLVAGGFDAEKYRGRIMTELKAAVSDTAENGVRKENPGPAQELLGLFAPPP